jgi:hypothetical protein
MSTSVATSSNTFVCELRHFCCTQDNHTSRCTILRPHLEESNERPSFFEGHAGGVYERLGPDRAGIRPTLRIVEHTEYFAAMQ